MTQIGFVRHGVTDWNLEGRAQGQIDIPLNAEGRQQARMIASRIVLMDWEVMYSSDLSRALQTAEAIASEVHLPIIQDKRIRERGYGSLEGLTHNERLDRYGSDWHQFDHGMESIPQVQARGKAFVQDILQRHPDQNVLVISHGACIGETLKTMIPEKEVATLTNTSLTIVEFKDGHWHTRLMNCSLHLTSLSQ